MSREAKYRCWHKQAKEYRVIESVDFDKDGKAECIVTLDYNTWHDPWNDLVEDVELEQYTGLKDKNGKEIYEGDIVNVIGIGIAQVIDSPSGEWVLYYRPEHDEMNNGSASLVPKNKPSGLWKTNTTSYIEVIGNIHENPELLGGEDE